MFPWTRHRLNVTRALKEQAVHSRNEVCRVILILEQAAAGSGLPAPMCKTEAATLSRTAEALMGKVAEAQSWLRLRRAVKSTPA